MLSRQRLTFDSHHVKNSHSSLGLAKIMVWFWVSFSFSMKKIWRLQFACIIKLMTHYIKSLQNSFTVHKNLKNSEQPKICRANDCGLDPPLRLRNPKVTLLILDNPISHYSTVLPRGRVRAIPRRSSVCTGGNRSTRRKPAVFGRVELGTLFSHSTTGIEPWSQSWKARVITTVPPAPQ